MSTLPTNIDENRENADSIHSLSYRTPAKIELTTACARHVDLKKLFLVYVLIGSVCVKLQAFCLVRGQGSQTPDT